MKFQPGDLVIVIDSQKGNLGKVGTIESRCQCGASLILAFTGLEVYKVAGLDCFVHTALKKIDGDRPKAETKTDETRDAPVAA